LEFTKRRLQKEFNYSVIGAVLIPTHDESLKKKNNGYLPVSAVHRERLIQLETSKSSWITAYFHSLRCEKSVGVH
jgi:hypothetical protein